MANPLARVVIEQSELFASWPDTARARLFSVADTQVLDAGAIVHRPGDTANYLYLVGSGTLMASRITEHGRSFITSLNPPGDFYGLGPVITRTPHVHLTLAKERTVLARIPGVTLREMLVTDGRLSFSLLAALARRHVQTQDLYVSASMNTTRARLAGLIISLAMKKCSAHQPLPVINLSQDELATMLGSRRQVVNRALREISATGALEIRYGRISILDLEALIEISKDMARAPVEKIDQGKSEASTPPTATSGGAHAAGLATGKTD